MLESFAVTAWYIWTHRNNSRLNECLIPLDRVVKSASNYLQLFQQSQIIKPKLKACSGKKTYIPPTDSYKRNFDGNWYGYLSEIIAAMSEKIPMPPFMVILESLPTRRAVLFTHEVGITQSSF